MLIKKFGMLVVSLSFLVQKIFVWLVLYFILEISFTSAIWMIYGYDQTKSTGLTSYYRVIFLLWLKTFGRQLNQAVKFFKYLKIILHLKRFFYFLEHE